MQTVGFLCAGGCSPWQHSGQAQIVQPRKGMPTSCANIHATRHTRGSLSAETDKNQATETCCFRQQHTLHHNTCSWLMLNMSRRCNHR